MNSRVNRSELTPELLREHLHYDPSTGAFTWLLPHKNIKVGDVAGHLGKGKQGGYIHIGLFKTVYGAHRLAWLYTYGEWPNGVIDHIDRSRANNRITNLRDATRTINARNLAGAYSTSTSKILGVYYDKRYSHWLANISVNKKRKYLGAFNSIEAARAARAAAELIYYPEKPVPSEIQSTVW